MTDVRGGDVLVVGAGVIGSAIAFRLAQRGARVVIVDRGEPGAAATANGFAGVTAALEEPVSIWGGIFAETRALAVDAGGDWLHLDGTLEWVLPADEAAQRSGVAHMRVSGVRVQECTPQEVAREIEPELHIDPSVPTVYFMPEQGWADGALMARSLVRAAERHSARFIRAAVVAFDRDGDRVIAARLGDGTALRADVVVNAAGPWADQIASLAGGHVSVERRPGAAVVTPPIGSRLRVAAYAPDVFVRPDGGGRVFVQRERFDAQLKEDSAPGFDHPLAKGAIEEAAAFVPRLQGAHVDAVRFGVRPIPKDGDPIIGPDPRVAGLYHAVMHSGIRRAAVAARAIARELCGDDVPELRPYREERFVEVS